MNQKHNLHSPDVWRGVCGRLVRVVTLPSAPQWHRMFCTQCRIKHSTQQLCRECGGCKRLCKCVRYYGGEIVRKSGVINRLPRALGTEIEFSVLNGMNKERFLGHWENDATITSGGMELVLAPAAGDEWVVQMDMVLQGLKKYKPQVDQTCGLHVHVQAGDIGWLGVRRLIALWGRVERSLFGSLVEIDRRRNIYCLPLVVTNKDYYWQFTQNTIVKMMSKRLAMRGKFKRWLIRKLYGIDVTEQEMVMRFRSIKGCKRTPGQAHGRGCRYATLNLHALFYQGTVEFRLKEGTIKPEELAMWPLVCGWLVESCTKLSDREVMQVNDIMDWARLAYKHGVLQKGVMLWVEEMWLNRKVVA